MLSAGLVDVLTQVDGGNFFKKFIINDFHLFRKTGEFSFTRKPYFFPLRKKKK